MTPETPPLGGVFELDLATVLETPEAPPRFPDAQSVTSGRTALALVVEQLGDGAWLLPAYLCDSVLQPLRAARIAFDFYSVGGDLRPRLDELERAVEEQRPTAVLVIDYFGFPPDEADRLRALRAACTVVEDAVQGSWLELPDAAAGGIGDVVFTSFRKYLPVPDGGIVRGVQPRELPSATGESVRTRLLGQLLRGAALAGNVGGDDVEPVFLRLLERGESALDAELPLEATSAVSERLLASLDLAEAAKRRRANFAALVAALDGIDAVTPLVRELRPGVSPLVLPVRIGGGRRDDVRQKLIRRRIFCPVHWPLPPEIERERFRDEHELADEMLGLPLDQRYEPADMERLAEHLRTSL